MTQCAAPKSKHDVDTRCPNRIRTGSIYCGIHRNCKHIYTSPDTHTNSQNTTSAINNVNVNDVNIVSSIITSPNFTHAINKQPKRQNRIRTISNDNLIQPRKRTKTRTTPSPQQISHTNNSPTLINTNQQYHGLGLSIPFISMIPPSLGPECILTPEFAITPGITNRYLDTLLNSEPSLATRTIAAFQLNKYRYLLNPPGIFTPNDRVLRFIQRIRAIMLTPNVLHAIKLIQRTWRRTRYRSIAHQRGPAWFRPMDICNNTTDFYTCQDLNDIPPRLLFTYQVPFNTSTGSHTQSIYYGFHLHSFLALIESATTTDDRRHQRYPTVLNPFDRTPIPSETIRRAQKYDMIIRHWCDLDGQPYNNIIDDAKKESLDNLSPDKRVEMRTLEIFQKIDMLGYYTNSNWLYGKSVEQLISFISAFNINWYVRLGLTDSIRKQILPSPWHKTIDELTSQHVMEEIILALGSFGPSISQSSTSDQSNTHHDADRILVIRHEIQYKLLNRILDCLDAMLTYPINDDARNTACIVILYSLAYINPREVVDSNPWMD